VEGGLQGQGRIGCVDRMLMKKNYLLMGYFPDSALWYDFIEVLNTMRATPPIV
jgi:hypothetical protein